MTISHELLEVFDVEPGHAAVDVRLTDEIVLELHVRTVDAARGGHRAWLVTSDDSWSRRLVPSLA